MSITDLIANDLTAALRAKEAAKVSALRMAKAALQRAEIAKRPAAFTDEDAVKALRAEVKKSAEAAGVYRQAISYVSLLEAAHRELMRCYARQGERGQALRHYQSLVELMRDELGAPPDPETTALFERLQRGEAV